MVSLGSNSNQIKIGIKTEGDTDGISKTQKALDAFNRDTEKSTLLTETLGRTAQVAKVGILALGTATAAAATIGFGFNSSVEQAETKLRAFMKDNVRVAETLAWVKEEAAATQFSFTDMADAAANLTPVAKSSGKSLKDLVKQAEILAAVNPAEGLTGATFSLREALSGDWVSIIDRFNLPRQRINELKEQGVPAMEIISRTLQEMGIDYSLVAEQGKTVSARFDQVKDKLVMMAGAASKPIFDRVSKELGQLGEFDFTQLGEKLSGTVSGAIKAFDEFIPRVQAVAKQIGEYLGPKLQDLFRAFNENIIPILKTLWKDVLEPLIPVIGTALVVAIGLATDGLKLLFDGIGWVIKAFQDGNPVVLGLAGVFGTLAAAMAFNAVFNALTVGFATLQFVTIPAMAAQVGWLAALIAAPIVMPAIAIGAALAAIAMVWNEYNKMKAAVEQAKQAANADMATTKKMIEENARIQGSGVYSQAVKDRYSAATNKAIASDKKLYGKYQGGPVTANQPYLVGENRDGSINDTTEMFVPKQSGKIVNSKDLQSMLGGRGGGNIYVTQHINNQVDYDKGIRELGFRIRM